MEPIQAKHSRYPFPATPDGWYTVAAASEIAPGEVKALHLLGRDLVLFRGEDGVARLFDAHCPHLGAHLGVGGRVVGDGLRCPFHGWRFAGSGCLAEVPGLEGRLPDAHVRSWPVQERNGFLFAWYHAEGLPPSFEIPSYREDGEWTEWASDAYRVRVHVQDLSENILDRAHFTCVHDMVEPERPRFEVRFEGPFMVVDQAMKVTASGGGGVEILSKSTNCGPGAVFVEVGFGPVETLTFIHQTPIDEEVVDLRIHFSMKRLEDEEMTRRIGETNRRITNDQFLQDIPIWENKVYQERPMLTPVDGPVARYRRWFRQFYSTLPDSNPQPAAR